MCVTLFVRDFIVKIRKKQWREHSLTQLSHNSAVIFILSQPVTLVGNQVEPDPEAELLFSPFLP